MNFEFFIAKRLLKEENSSFSKPIVRIATLSIALSIAVMIVSVAVLGGFKKQIREKSQDLLPTFTSVRFR